MKIAALSDIHSNVFALHAVVQDAERRGVDLVVNLGDALYGPIAPKATFDYLKKNDFVTICGNQDRLLFEATSKDVESNPTLRFVLDELGEEPLGWLKTLPFDHHLNEEIYLCHGAPASDTIYLLEDIESGVARVRSDREIRELLIGVSSSLVICGHTHLPRTVMLSSEQVVVNPGSVGLPAYTDDEPAPHSMENFCPHASYAIIESSQAGWGIEHIKVAYDFQEAARAAASLERDDWVHFLTTGRGL